jgi:DNA helicase HerA-like ATPase/outer membrane lipoprotein SlyB
MTELAVKEQTADVAGIWELFDGMIAKSSLDMIPLMQAVETKDDFKKALNTARIDRIAKIVYDKKEDNLVKFNSLFSAVGSAASAVFVLLHGHGETTDIYLGINAQESRTASTSMATMESALHGNFPGVISQVVDQGELCKISEQIRQGKCISCVTGIPSLKNDKDIPFAQGLEKIIDALGDKPYTALFLATPVSTQQISEAEAAYQNLYSQLSLLNLNQMSLTQQQSVALAKSIGSSYSTALSTNISHTNTTTDTKTKTSSNAKSTSNSKSRALTEQLTENITNTQGETQSHTDGASSSETKGTSKSHTTNYGAVGKTAGGLVGGIIGFCIGGPFGAAMGAAIGAGAGGTIGDLAGSSTKTMSSSNTLTESHSDTTSQTSSVAKSKGHSKGETVTSTNTATETNTLSDAISKSNAISEQKGRGETKTEQTSQQDSETNTHLNGISYNYAVVEKRVVEAEKILDEQLQRLRQAKNYGGWNWAAYFIGNTNDVISIGANVFSGVLRGEQSGVEHSSIMHWDNQDENLPAIQNELAKFRHPVFDDGKGGMFSPTSLLSTPELTVGMSLPQKSLPGVPVFFTAEFGRSVIYTSMDRLARKPFHFGHVVHLDRDYENMPVDLDLDSLTSHAFITGSTGSGKSNAIYGLLKELREKRIPFLVVEPAKGEYKDVFGGLRNVSVFGTNPYLSELLRINPFSFPEEIHIIEHIDRLIEILNAAWPMYSAMPAILKKAVEITYENCGWNLLTSRNIHSPAVFPDFTDLMNVLPDVIEKTEYSAEVTGNYKGALLERVGSLTNGYYRSIFQKDELPLDVLFDKNVIVDLSRVSSLETKALLMGVLFQKLQEYRIAKATTANAELKHVTVLEEAHHLLRKTSTAQGDESANLTGKSIEMLTNAIAEMRTYGEGFIIADQAPDLLDPAVIRNTNTKIVFNLPDFIDRDLVGKAEGLSDEQIEELAHLRRGYACVYQNNWQEAVICKVNKFDATKMTNMGSAPKYNFESPMSEELKLDSRTQTEADIIKSLLLHLQQGVTHLDETTMRSILQYIPNSSVSATDINRDILINCLNEILIKEKIENAPFSPNMSTWTHNLLKSIVSDRRTIDLTDDLKDELSKMTFKILLMYEKDPRQKETWKNAYEDEKCWRMWK